MSTERPANRGLQGERTLLAWQRTRLTLAVGFVVWIRVLSGELGAIAVAIGLLGLIAVGLPWSLSTLRYHRWRGQMLEPGEGMRVSGAPIAALAMTTASAGLLGLVAIALL